MSISVFKKLISSAPWPLGKFISFIPYGSRPFFGGEYRRKNHEIKKFELLNKYSQHEYVLKNFIASLKIAFKTKFYSTLYKQYDISISDIKSINDIEKIPIVTKEMLREWDINERSNKTRFRYKSNTGGTAGAPLSFYLTPMMISHEWAHMHTIWSKLGYDQSQAKFLIAGFHNEGQGIKYDGLRHSYVINPYLNIKDLKEELKIILLSKKINYLHGYPSAVCEFVVSFKQEFPDLLNLLKKHLRGVFLGSEFPAPNYRNQIESILEVPTISWYGHTEGSILAFEKNKPFVYEPFHTYGFAEAIKHESNYKLIATSFNNCASPFIRYDTGDLIGDVKFNNDLLYSFSISDGRVGDFILDKNNMKVPLTSLLFGRHHKIFDIVRHIQIMQSKPGFATFLIAKDLNFPSKFRLENWFNLDFCEIKFDYTLIEKPILSSSGKIKLKIPYNNYIN